MAQIKQICYRWYVEPLKWIFFCFFQPLRFEKDINTKDRRIRYLRMCRLALPILTLVYPITILARFLLYNTSPDVYGYYIAYDGDPMQESMHLFLFIFDASWAVLLALAVVIILGPPIVGLSYCIAAGLIACFWGGVAVHTGLGTPGYLLIAGCVVGALGLTIGVSIASARDIKLSAKEARATAVGSLVGMVGGIAMGFGLGLLAAQLCGTAMYSTTLALEPRSIAASTLSAILGAAFGAIAMVIVAAVVRGIERTRALLNSGIERALALGMVTSIACSAAIGGVMGTAYGGSGGEAGYALGINSYVLPNLLVVPIFIATYALGLYRLPLYPFSAYSTIKLAINSYYKPLHVFTYLHRSSLYWDEAVYLPLPGLKQMLYHAIEVDIEETLQIASFIVEERVLQLNEVRPVVREIILRDLEERETIEQIAHAHTRLREIIPEEALLIDPRWQLPFIRLEDASLEAARFCTPQSRQSRRDTLEQIVLNLKRVPVKNAFENVALNARLETIVQRWLDVARREREKLDDAPETLGNIDNPYICGPALKANTQQFVGRRDLAGQLQQALSKENYRPSIFLQGERRMGKTSTLNQLPLLLGARYLPIIFDLQSRGMTSNIATFLAEIARAIHSAMSMRSMSVPLLEYVILQAAKYENEAAVYHQFDTWLTQVEEVLARENRTILIAFDEFEKLEEAGKAQYFDLNLLLDWFRSTIQNRTYLALLFSGVKTLNEMEANWPGYFVNMRTLRVTFLRPVEALQLVTQPVNNYPGQQIFTPEAVEDILRVTGRHPFLIQAVCSELIELLNTELREQATIEDVQEAVVAMFEHWEDTYFADLWRRTSDQQRLCLYLLQSYKQANFVQMLDSSRLEKRVLQETLQELRRRDLILQENDYYQIATPMHVMWVEQNR